MTESYWSNCFHPVVVCLATWLLALAPAAEGQEIRGSVAGGSGLQVATFEAPAGRVYVNLPADARPGDTISGTVSLEPAGRTEEERSANLGVLRGYVVEVGDHEVPAAEPHWTFDVPPGTGASFPVGLRHGPGRDRMTRVAVPVGQEPCPEQPGTAETFAWPEVGQAGSPLPVTGPFDGRFETGGVSVGDVEALPLAESPRRLIVRAPADVTGPAELRVREGSAGRSGPYRNVRVQLSAGRLNLRNGEQTPLRVSVAGLQGLEKPLSLQIANGSPTVVRLAGGNTQTVAVPPDAVAPDGTSEWTGTLTGLRPGGFNVTASVPQTHTPCPESPGRSTPTTAPGGEPVPIQDREGCTCQKVDWSIAERQKLLDGAAATVQVSQDLTSADVTLELPLETRLGCSRGRGDCAADLLVSAVSERWSHQRSDQGWEPAVWRQERVEVKERLPGQQARIRGAAFSLTGACNDEKTEKWLLRYTARLLPSAAQGGRTRFEERRFLGVVRLRIRSESLECPLDKTVRLQIDKGQAQGLDFALSDVDGDGVVEEYDRLIRPGPEPREGQARRCRCEELTVAVEDDRTKKPLPTASADGGSSLLRVKVELPVKSTLRCSLPRASQDSCWGTVRIQAEVLDRDDPETREFWDFERDTGVVRTQPLEHTAWIVPRRQILEAKCGAETATPETATFHVVVPGEKPLTGAVQFMLTPLCDGMPGTSKVIKVPLKIPGNSGDGGIDWERYREWNPN